MTVLLTQVLCANEWRTSQSVASHVLPTTNSLTFSLNDPDSVSTQGLRRLNTGTVQTPSAGTANFDNPQQKIVEIGSYEDLIRSLPPPYPKSCDYLLFTQDSSHVVLVELKVLERPKEPREQLRQSLSAIWPTAKARFANCPNKWCCLFRQVPVTTWTAPTITAVSAFNSVNTRTEAQQDGIWKTDPTINGSGFLFGIFTNTQRCRLA